MTLQEWGLLVLGLANTVTIVYLLLINSMQRTINGAFARTLLELQGKKVEAKEK